MTYKHKALQAARAYRPIATEIIERRYGWRATTGLFGGFVTFLLGTFLAIVNPGGILPSGSVAGVYDYAMVAVLTSGVVGAILASVGLYAREVLWDARPASVEDIESVKLLACDDPEWRAIVAAWLETLGELRNAEMGLLRPAMQAHERELATSELRRQLA